MSHHWNYKAPKNNYIESIQDEKQNIERCPQPSSFINLGSYHRKHVSNLDITPLTEEATKSVGPTARDYFNQGLLYYFGYQHEESIKSFLNCLKLAPDCLLAHGMIALCHGPNYNFNGETYYNSTNYEETYNEQQKEEGLDIYYHHNHFPSQQIASLYSNLAITKMQAFHRTKRRNSFKKQQPTAKRKVITEKESDLLKAIAILTSYPGIQPELAEETVGRPFANALKKIKKRYPDDADVIYFYVESLMVLNAWNLYEYPNGSAKTPDVLEVQKVLESALLEHPHHPGLCHLYVHLCEMSSRPDAALDACMVLRNQVPDLGHLIHMATHTDVLVGDYVSCIHYNILAIEADMKLYKANPDTAGPLSFYFGYVVHNFHMLVYGALLGGMEGIALKNISYLNSILNEELFQENPELTVYLESYSAMEIHVMVRFGRWEEILWIHLPKNHTLMFFRTATLLNARALAYTQLGQIEKGKEEADLFDKFCNDNIAIAHEHILHNNSIGSLLEVDRVMLRGEITYREGKYEEAFDLLRLAVELQDSLHYDEPWGKMQPVRHALGGLLLEQGFVKDAEEVFRDDLKYHPKNPWSLYGLIRCLEPYSSDCCSKGVDTVGAQDELNSLKLQFREQRGLKWVDFDVTAPCMCCEQKKINL